MKMKKSYKGIYKPRYPRKYVGDVNRIVYRSLLERRFMVYCDMNPDIIQWASEEISIKYVSPLDGRLHRYFPDFIVETAKKKQYMIEVKPYRQCMPPKKKKRVSRVYLHEKLTFSKNQAKWKAARAWCKLHRMEFKIFTEKELGKK